MSNLCACGCGRELPPRRGPGRPAKYLAEHAPDKRQGLRKRTAPVPAIAPVTAKAAPRRTQPKPAPAPPVPAPPIAPVVSLPAPPEPEPEEPALVAATRADLERVGRAESPEGLIVLTLAAQIAAGGGTQSGLASLVRQFHASKAQAMEGAEAEADVVEGIFGTGS